MQGMRSDPWRAPDFRQVVTSAGKTCCLFTLSGKLPPQKAACAEEIRRKLASLALPGMLAPEQIVSGEDRDAVLADCGLYRPLLQPGAVGKCSVENIDWLVLDLAGKLKDLHGQGILVQTLAPGFLLVNTDGEHFRGAVTGFLDARDLAAPVPEEAPDLYDADFAAPEVRENGLPGPAADVYALGVLYHLLLSGMMPETEEDADGWGRREPRLSGRLDMPHRALLERMLAEDPAARPQQMDEVCGEIRRILFFGDCYLGIRCPDLANRFIIIQGSRGGKIRKKLDQAGSARVGPLLSDQEYTVSCRSRVLFRESFPGAERGQVLWLSDEEDREVREVERFLPPLSRKKTIPQVMQASVQESLDLDPPLNNICRIDFLNGPFCILTLVNGRSFWIRKEAAPRYGIAYLVQERQGG